MLRLRFARYFPSVGNRHTLVGLVIFCCLAVSGATGKDQPEIATRIEKMRLTGADDFMGAAKSLPEGSVDLLTAQMRYELLMAASAKGNREAKSRLALAWDDLLFALGRPIRTEEGLAARTDAGTKFAPAPDFIQSVLRDPAAAIIANKAVEDNPELKDLNAYQRPAFNEKSNPKGARLTIALNANQIAGRTQSLIAAQKLRTKQDFTRAAELTLKLDLPVTELSHELALCALLLGSPEAGPLVAATYDRFLRTHQQPQRFGTQIDALGLAPLNSAGIGDSVRNALGCPDLDRIKQPARVAFRLEELVAEANRLKQQNRIDDAVIVERRIVAEARQVTKKDDPPVRLAGFLMTLALSLNQTGNFTEAEPAAREAYNLRLQSFGPKEWSVQSAAGALGSSLAGQRRYDEARPLLEKAYAGLVANPQLPPRFRSRIREVAGELVKLHLAQDRPGETEAWQRKVADYDTRYGAR